MKNHTVLVALSVLAFSVSSLSFGASSRAYVVKDSISRAPVTGTLTDGGLFKGTLSITGLSEDRYGDLVASGVMAGTVSSFFSEGTPAVNHSFQKVRATISANEGTCSLVTLDIADMEVPDVDTFIDLAPLKLDVRASAGSEKSLGKLLCSVANAVDSPSGGSGLLGGLLGQVNDLLGGLLGEDGPVGGLIGEDGPLGGILGEDGPLGGILDGLLGGSDDN